MTEMSGHDAEIGGHVGPKYARWPSFELGNFEGRCSHVLFAPECLRRASPSQKDVDCDELLPQYRSSVQGGEKRLDAGLPLGHLD